ncbi:MAG: agmatine deiminase family protein, partial [Bacteroidota bacterium]
GTPRVLWLEGDLQGDDTDGHVDNLARFADSRTVFAVSDPDPAAPHYHALQENLRLLRAARTLDGRTLQVVELPMPARTEHNGTVLPASYANFLIANRVVLMPAYGGPQDDAAQHLLRRAFPHRTIVPVDCRHVVIGLGAVHCLTQHVPASHA